MKLVGAGPGVTPAAVAPGCFNLAAAIAGVTQQPNNVTGAKGFLDPILALESSIQQSQLGHPNVVMAVQLNPLQLKFTPEIYPDKNVGTFPAGQFNPNALNLHVGQYNFATLVRVQSPDGNGALSWLWQNHGTYQTTTKYDARIYLEMPLKEWKKANTYYLTVPSTHASSPSTGTKQGIR